MVVLTGLGPTFRQRKPDGRYPQRHHRCLRLAPSTADTYSAQVKVTDPYGASATKKVALNVSALALTNISLTRSSTGTLTCTFQITNPSTTQTATNVTLTVGI